MSSLEWNVKSFVWKILYCHAGHVNMTTPIKPAVCLKKHDELNPPLTGMVLLCFKTIDLFKEYLNVLLLSFQLLPNTMYILLISSHCIEQPLQMLII
jgi:hypothetical protein